MGPSSVSRVYNIELDAHPTESAIVLRYQLEPSEKGLNPSKVVQSVIYLKDLKDNIDVSILARHILSKTPIIPDHKLPEIEQLCFFLVKRSASLPPSITAPLMAGSVSNISADISKLDAYIENLYDSNSEQVKACTQILALARTHSYLSILTANETLLSALARVFRDEWKKNFEIATNIALIFLQLAHFSNFHPLLSQNKVGAMFIQVVEFEQKRREAWLEDVKNAGVQSTTTPPQTPPQVVKKKWELALKKQDQLLLHVYQLLILLADDVKVEWKIVNKGIVALLSTCLTLQPSDPLFLIVLNFLWKLSCYQENRQSFIEHHVVERLSKKINSKEVNKTVRKVAFKLLFNLSFDDTLRTKMVKLGIVAIVAPFIEEMETAPNLLYQLSILDDAKAMITFTDTIQTLMRKVIEGSATITDKALLINISMEKRNAQLICGANGSGLNYLLDQALTSPSTPDTALIKVIKNVATHTGTTQNLFDHNKYLDLFVGTYIDKCYDPTIKVLAEGGVLNDYLSDTEKVRNYSFGLDCLGTATNIPSKNWVQVMDKFGIIEKMQVTFSQVKPILVPDDQLLQLVMLASTIANTLEGANEIMKLNDVLIALLNIKQVDDEIVVQIVYLFYCLLIHEPCCQLLMAPGGKGEIATYLIDLMYDTNQTIRAMCDQALQVISESSKEWAKKIDAKRFQWHNMQWLETIEKSNLDQFESNEWSENGDTFQGVMGVDEFFDRGKEDTFGDDY
uniref:ARM repeat-containing protein n=1 Tax=Rhabditophanes sp. KR3021 TaxID=114890 RepID=A0AC35UG17_9BILA